MIVHFLWMTGGVTVALLLGAGVLHALPRLGHRGRWLSDQCCRTPTLDLLITYFIIAPLVVGPILGGWVGLAGAVCGQFVSLQIWQFLHELAHPAASKGPRIVRLHNTHIGAWRNLTAVYLTAIVVPLFWFVRLAQVCIYPLLTKLVRLPPYRHADWVNVSRHKFEGLVGHDLIWCLYCDWMTGVWSLGSEMLRNVESFWCPIRFASAKKCENCRIDFPDVEHGWVPADTTMAEVVATLEQMYPPSTRQQTYRPWFGHPARLTINGIPQSACKPAENLRKLDVEAQH